MAFLIYFVPGIIVLLGASAYYFFKERLVEKLLKILAISFYSLGGLYGFVLAMTSLNGFSAKIFDGSIDINYKLLICIPIYVVLALVLSKLANKLDSKNGADTNE